MARSPVHSDPSHTATASAAADAAPLLHFVLRQAKVKTNVCTRQIFSTGYELPRRTVHDYNLIYITKGKVTWVIDQTPYPLSPGDLVIVPPGVQHHAFSQTRKIDLSSLHLEVTLPGGQDVFSLLSPPVFQHVAATSRLASYLAGFTREFVRRDPFMTPLVNPGWGRLIGLELLWHDAKLNLLTHRTIEPLITQILAELDSRLKEDVTLESLASWAGYSPQHLNRVFRKVLGVTPLQHLTRMRLEQAAALLAENQLTVLAIAQSVGISDPYYFSRLFKQHYGQSPAHYRQSIEHHQC